MPGKDEMSTKALLVMRYPSRLLQIQRGLNRCGVPMSRGGKNGSLYPPDYPVMETLGEDWDKHNNSNLNCISITSN